MKAAFYTLGCKVNQYDTQIMEQSMRDAGFEIVSPYKKTDVLVVNSCTVTAESDRKTRQIFRRLKHQNPNALAVLCGCYVQASPQKAASIQEADIITGVRDRKGIAQLILTALKGKNVQTTISSFSKDEQFEPMCAKSFLGHTRAFVKIEDGCQNYCTYCIIPFSRGPVRSKSPEEIQIELSSLQQNGYKEVVLVGINLSAYGLGKNKNLSDAVDAAAQTGLSRIRLGSLSPLVITDSFLHHMKQQSAFCPHFHLSLQSGCTATLKRMNRHYTAEDVEQAVKKIRKVFSNNCGISIDVITGFPGETEKEFDESLTFVRNMAFSQAHVFPYSRRENTRAASMSQQLSNAEKEKRAHQMIAACTQTQQDFRKRFLKKCIPVLFERQADTGEWEGFSPQYFPVRVISNQNLHGQIKNVWITEVDKAACLGHLEHSL